ncbi:MAG TPA: carboxypeptidase regulatory-like domain-containing protein [Acidobacteriaceae bacterium]|jgi:hypothetical protein|nr:carboxypeptidase regulatory-like domain-containing protein [Acidobacteriaceae bacterium]
MRLSQKPPGNLIVLWMVLLFTGTAFGQIAAGDIQGKVTDPSGGAIPNATVTASSPALQLPKIVAKTDADGNYEFRDLPAPGVYRLAFECAGFQALVRENLNLPVGFTARVDASLKIGEVTSTVEVYGESPVVDTESATRSVNIPLEDLEQVPKGGGMQELYTMAEGVSVTGKPDVGDSNIGTRAGASTYGAPLGPSIRLEGIDLEDGDHGNDTGMYLSGYDLAEVQFKTTGQTADVGNPGFDMESVMKQGSNEFHGQVFGEYENSAFQSNNVTPALSAQGIKVTNPLVNYYTFTAEVGGKILRDKLWFYGGLSRQYSHTGAIAFVAGPDANGCWTCGDAPPAYFINQLPQYNVKLNYQPTKKISANFVYSLAHKNENAFAGSATVPLPSSEIQYQTVYVVKGELQWVLSERAVLDVIAGKAYSISPYTPQPGMDKLGQPSSQEVSNGLYTGPQYQPISRPSARYPLRANLAYSWRAHLLKFGTDLIPSEGRQTQVLHDQAHGDYLLLFNKGLPYEVNLYNYPVTQTNSYNAEAIYAMDTWKIKRLSATYGVRWDRYHNYYGPQHKPAGQFSAVGDYPGRSILVFNDLVPRVGVAWDIFGSGKTVVKATYGRFGDTMQSAYAGNFNPNGITTTTYKWSGPCVDTGFDNVSYLQPNTSCDISTDTLATLTPSSPNFVSATGGINQVVNPNLKQPKIDNYTFRFEQQLIPNVALSAGFVRYDVSYLSPYSGTAGNTIFPNRPYSAYSVPVPLVDPGTGNTVAVYTYPSSYKGPQFSQTEYVSAPGSRANHYTTFEVAITKRYSKRWNASASFWTTKNDAWVTAVPSNPNLLPFPQDETRHWQALGTLIYNGPWGIHASTYYRGISGTPGQRTVNFTSPLLLQGTVTMNMEQLGAEEGPEISIVDLEVGKIFKFKKERSLEVDYQSFNLFNGSAATSISYLTGSTYGRVTGIVSPQVGRFSARLRF